MRLALVLLLLAALCSFAWMHFEQGDDAPNIVAAAARHPARETPHPASNGDAPTSIAVISPSAPLFRPMLAPNGEGQTQPGQSFSLMGIIVRDGQPLAFLRDEADGRQLRLSNGDHAGAWTITGIDSNCITLARRRQRERKCV